VTHLDLRGLIPATVLPMTEDARVDEHGLRRYVAHVAAAGPKALAINADTGEGPHLWPDERRRVLEIVVDEVGDRVPIVAGLGAQFTEQAVKTAREFAAVGAAAFLVFPISAYQGEPLDPEIPVRYHAAIGEATGLPLVLFNLQPALGGVNFSAETLFRLCHVTEVAAIKEASFDAKLFVEVREAVKAARPECVVLTGNDNFVYESFVLGAEGALIGFGAVATRLQVEMIELAIAGRFREAKATWERLRPLEEAIFARPVRDYRARTKEVLVMQRLLDRATVREPLLPIDDDDRRRLQEALARVGEPEPLAVGS
jgi:4-hydroxy-tetrahydrodipicolinate synthase